MTKKEIAESIQKEINWDNWTDVNGKPMKTNDVLLGKLCILEESFCLKENLEAQETIDMVKKVLQLIDIDDIVNNAYESTRKIKYI